MVGGTFVWVNGYRFGPGSRVVCLWCHWVHLLRHVLKPTAYWFIYCKSNPSTLLYQVRKGLITSPCNDDETVMSRLALILKYTDLFLSGLSYFNDSNKLSPNHNTLSQNSLLYCHLGSCQNRLATMPNDTNVAGTNDDTVTVRTQKGQMLPSGCAVGTSNTFYIHFLFMSAV